MHEFAQDITVILDQDRPGALGEVLEIVARQGINLEGYTLIEGILHVLTKDAARARQALEGAGVRVRRQRKVLIVYADNRVGSAAEIYRQIAAAGINMHFSYVAADNRVVIGADRLDELAKMPLGNTA